MAPLKRAPHSIERSTTGHEKKGIVSLVPLELSIFIMLIPLITYAPRRIAISTSFTYPLYALRLDSLLFTNFNTMYGRNILTITRAATIPRSTHFHFPFLGL